MLEKISIRIHLTCPNCGNNIAHEHEFKLKSTIDAYKSGKLTAIGHTMPLYEHALNFNCPKCGCLHSTEIEPIEVHVHPDVTHHCDTEVDESCEYDEEELSACPKCGRDYDDADFDFQICHYCRWDAIKKIYLEW
jgi:predicted RNA-binding Zn-ribbon protein involved in translation (DUF1610 family)